MLFRSGQSTRSPRQELSQTEQTRSLQPTIEHPCSRRCEPLRPLSTHSNSLFRPLDLADLFSSPLRCRRLTSTSPPHTHSAPAEFSRGHVWRAQGDIIQQSRGACGLVLSRQIWTRNMKMLPSWHRLTRPLYSKKVQFSVHVRWGMLAQGSKERADSWNSTSIQPESYLAPKMQSGTSRSCLQT